MYLSTFNYGKMSFSYTKILFQNFFISQNNFLISNAYKSNTLSNKCIPNCTKNYNKMYTS